MSVAPSVPGPLCLDLRASSPLGALRAVERALLRPGRGARLVVLRCAGKDTIEALLHWADDLDLPLERLAGPAGTEELRLYLLPASFDDHPLSATPLRPPVRTHAPLATRAP